MEGDTPGARPAASDETTGHVTRLEHAGREFFLVGTAHVSRKSVDEVRRVIDELRPDTVCVELDEPRLQTLADEGRWRLLDALAIVRGDRAGLFLSSLLFSGFQKRLGDRLGVRPGEEMLAAVDEARRIGAQVVLADRDVQATLMRCYRSLGLLDRAKVLFVLVMLPFAASDIDEAQVEKLKERETMTDAMTTFAREMPALETPLITERDRYLMASVENAAGRRIVAIVGAAHVPGMTRHLGSNADRAALSVVPERSLSSRASSFIPPVLVAALVALGAFKGAGALRLVSLLAPCAVPSAAGAFILGWLVGATLWTSLLAGVLAPFTLVLPFVDIGRIAGTVQFGLRPPSPEDGAKLRDDILTPRSVRANPFLRVLLAAVAPGFGRSLGAALGFVWAVVRLAKFH